MSNFKAAINGLYGPSQKHTRAGCFGFSSGASSPSWLDVRVVYARVNSISRDENPECLTFKLLSRNIDTSLEVNGGRISPSEEPFLSLRRDRVDVDSMEATYVSTNNLRTSGLLSFEIYDKDEVLISGSIQKSESICEHRAAEDFDAEKVSWSMECCCAVGPGGCTFFKGRQDYATMHVPPPVVEICLVGHFNGCPVVLSGSVELTPRRRLARVGTLDAIPEDEESDSIWDNLLSDKQNLPEEDLEAYLRHKEKGDLLATFYGSDIGTHYIEDDDGEVSWFNAGVRVGVGIGLGMCLGVGIGVGLLVRTYQATTRTFRRRIL